MRAQSNIWFSEFLLLIGNGTEESIANDYMQLPDDILIEYESEESIHMLIDRVFRDLESKWTSAAYMRERAILSTRNEHVDSLNALMIDKFPGKEKVYYSHDSVHDDSHNNYPLDFLNSITPNGLPPHELKIKNCPIILLRNIDPHNGLCNGTEESFANDYAQLPNDVLIEYESEESIHILIDRVFPDLESKWTSAAYMRERAILSTRNEHVDSLNALMIDKFSGKEKVYYSHDSVDDDSHNNYPLDFLNSITPNGLPPHELKIKKFARLYFFATLTLIMDCVMVLVWLSKGLTTTQLIVRL